MYIEAELTTKQFRMKIWISILFITFASSLFGIETTIRFRQLSPEGGFTHSSIHTIEQDNQGFVWFGTRNGLYKYNSRQIKKYSHNSGDPNSLIDNRINRIVNGPSNKLWIATESALCHYNKDRDHFEPFPLYNALKQKVDEDIQSMVFDSKGNLWVLNKYGIGKIDPINHLVEFMDVDLEISPRHLYFDEKERMWLTTKTGHLYLANKPYKHFEPFAQIRDARINTIAVKNDKIWLGYQWKGVDCIDLNGELIEHYEEANKKSLRLPSNLVRSIYIDQSDRIWIGTWDGISLIDVDGSNTIIRKVMYNDFPHNSVYKVFEDDKQGIWIGSWSGGLCYYNNYDNAFLHYKSDPSLKSLSDNVISSFAEDKCGNILVGTELGGLNKFNRRNNTFSTEEFDLGENKVINIKSVIVDNHGTVWAGLFKYGLWVKQIGDNKFHQFKHPKFNGQHIYALSQNGNTIWIGTHGKGLFQYDLETKKLVNLLHDPINPFTLSDNHIRHVFTDSKNNLWASTSLGLSFRKSGSEKFKRFFNEKNNPHSLNVDEMFYCFEDSRHIIWIGTRGGGLSRVNTDDFKFYNYTTDDGLAGNDVYGIQEDSKGNLWISTDQGLSCFNPDNEKFRNFSSIDGIQANQFNPASVCKTSKGELIFGGPNGFSLFHPDKIKLNPRLPKATISGFKIKNIKENISDYLEHNNNDEERLVLDYDQNSFSFSFVADNYLLPMKNRFKYRLRDFNDEWVRTKNPVALYTNIPSGTYTFEVLASNNDGVWNSEPLKLVVKINSHILLSKLALFLYLISIVGIILLTRKIIFDKQKLLQDVALERSQRKNEEELHQMKLKFFTNISHEFRTPLSLILMPLEQIINKNILKGKMQHDLQLMKNNATRLLRLINQLMDLRRIDNQKTRLIPNRANIVLFCREIYDCFEIYAERKEINYHFEADDDVVDVDFDPKMVDKIVYNLLSNAFKFSDEKDSIRLIIKQNNTVLSDGELNEAFKIGELADTDYVEISVQDTGFGIAKENLTKIFERFYQVDEKHNRSTGIGLALSREYIQYHNGAIFVHTKLKEGSLFAVRIPLRQKNVEPVNKTEVKASFEHQVSEDYNLEDELVTATKTTVVNNGIEQSKELILLIEDNAELAQFVESILISDYKVISAVDGMQGVQKAIKYMPDLIISDIMMPKMDGLELSKTIMEDIRISHIPIILLTALDSDEDQLKGLKTGITDYLTKPFNEKVFHVKIANILETRRKLREKYAGDKTVWAGKMDFISTEKIFVDKVQQIVEQNINNSDFSVEELAEFASISRSQLHRKLKYLTNQNATEFIRYVRLEKAVDLIKNGHDEIDKIGYAVGFSSHSYFTLCFKNQFGQTPSQYMQDLKNGE
jgi:signal transduction histidine kinase/ligand-binding sensor domain-containing protein/DNA-binding response OmpR family regulator